MSTGWTISKILHHARVFCHHVLMVLSKQLWLAILYRCECGLEIMKAMQTFLVAILAERRPIDSGGVVEIALAVQNKEDRRCRVL